MVTFRHERVHEAEILFPAGTDAVEGETMGTGEGIVADAGAESELVDTPRPTRPR